MQNFNNEKLVEKIMSAQVVGDNFKCNRAEENTIVDDDFMSLILESRGGTKDLLHILTDAKLSDDESHLILSDNPTRVEYNYNGKNLVFHIPKKIPLFRSRKIAKFQGVIHDYTNLRDYSGNFEIHVGPFNPYGHGIITRPVVSISSLEWDKISKDIIKSAEVQLQKESLNETIKANSRYSDAELKRKCGFKPGSLSPKVIGNSIQLDSFHITEKSCSIMEQLAQNYPQHPQEEYIENINIGISQGKLRDSSEFTFKHCHLKKFEGWFQQVYPVKNEYGEIIKLILKIYNMQTGEKVLIPITNWAKDWCQQRRMYCTPTPGEQHLFNLPDLMKHTDKPLVFCDGIEQTEMFKTILGQDFIVTGAPFDDDYEFYDFTPVDSERPVYIQVMNHSGLGIGECYSRSQRIADKLEDECGVKAQFIHAEINYATAHAPLADIPALLKFHRENPPRVIHESVMVLEREQLDQFARQYAESKLYKEKAIWLQDAPRAEASDKEVDEQAEQEIPTALKYYIRPILEPGEVTLCSAQSGCGKTPWWISACASYIGGERFFLEGKFWTTSVGTIAVPKVLYLNYESAINLSGKDSNLVKPYLDKDPATRKKQLENFIIKKVDSHDLNLSKQSNHQRVFDLISEAENIGTKGAPVTVIVIDTLVKALGGVEYGASSWEGFQPLVEKLRAAGFAVVLLSHQNQAGNARGAQEKVFDACNRLKLTRGSKAKTLSDPMTIELERAKNSHIAHDKEPFDVKFVQGEGWAIAGEEHDPLLDLHSLITEYKVLGHSRDAIAELLGYKKSQYSKKKKEAEAKYGKIK